MRVIKFIFIGVFVIAVLIGAYIFFLSPNERWLFFSKADAEQYGNALLSNDVKTVETFKVRFIDCLIVSNPNIKTVLFSPHDNHDVALIYAPTYDGKELIYESEKAAKITDKWYALKLTE